MDIIKLLALELNQKEEYVANVVQLLDNGDTVPFIARYRKELHGSMDDETLRELSERLEYLRSLDKRREEVKKLIEAQGKLTEVLCAEIEKAFTLTALEDIYRPYRPKRRTRASIAKDKGLEPLAEIIIAQSTEAQPLKELAEGFVNADNGVDSYEQALNGASDIIAERISENAQARGMLRDTILRFGEIVSLATTEEDSVYRLYYDFKQKLSKIQGHQVLAMNRGEAEKLLKISVSVPDEMALPPLIRMFVIPGREYSDFIRRSAEDAYARLMLPSLEREIRGIITDKACDGAMHNFAMNLKSLLMQPPVRGNVTLGFDPGYKNGCKLAVVDGTGKVLDTAVIYPTAPYKKVAESKNILLRLIRTYGITNIALGNGTASRESEEFISDVIKDQKSVSYMVVSEAGASVYSASKLASEEFPEYDVNIRSAVSIARRLQDPLAELVKIDPKAIGVGQYQHDMPQSRLTEVLTAVVEDCVNSVGADLNTASPALLAHISGLTKITAKNIVNYRDENGPFKERKDLMKVPKLGPKAFEQCAGFLRIAGGNSPLDNTAVHPESYAAAEKLLDICGYKMSDMGSGLSEIKERTQKIGEEVLAERCGIGIPTLKDIISNLMKPGRDPRDELPSPIMRSGSVMDIKDLKPGMILTGTVRNVIDFGAFVDIGVHQDGLVHISQISNKFIKHPSEGLSVGDIVKTVVLEADAEKGRISLSIKQAKDS